MRYYIILFVLFTAQAAFGQGYIQKLSAGITDGANQYFSITTGGNVTVHVGDVYTDVSSYGTGYFTIRTGGTNVTSITATSTSRPQSPNEVWTKYSGNAGSTASFVMQNVEDNQAPGFSFSNEASTGIVRYGTNDFGFTVNGQTIFEAATRTFNGVTGNVVSVGSPYPSGDPDTIFTASGFYPDVAKFTFANNDYTSASSGSEILACDGSNELTCTSFENYAGNTEYVSYMNNVGALFARQYLNGLLIGSENNFYTLTLSAPASITIGTVYTDPNGSTFTVSASTSSSSSLVVFGPAFPAASYNPAASGTLTYVSGPTTGNKTYTSFTSVGYVAFTAGGRLSNNEVLRLTPTSVSTSNQVPFLTGDGTAAAPGFAFAAEPDTGWMRSASVNPTLVVNSVKALDAKWVAANQINFGLSTTASSTVGYPLVTGNNYNGTSYFQLQNANESSSSATVLQVLNGAYSSASPKFATVSLENWAYNGSAVYGAVLSSGTNIGGTMLITNEWGYSGGIIDLGIGGRASGNIALQVTATSVGVQNNALFQLQVQGAGVTPTCGSGAAGSLALTSAYLLCVCNGSGWVHAATGATSCTF